MNDMLHELENNEAILLMYIAGELADEERREVEQMLSSDANLRLMHDALRAAWASGMEGIERLDRLEPLPTARDAAARQVGRMVRQIHADKLAAAARVVVPPPQRRSMRVPWFLGSASAAALLLIGFLVWWGWTDVVPSNRLAATTEAGPVEEPVVLRGYSAWMNVDEPAEGGTYRVVTVDMTGLASNDLSSVESELSELAAPVDDSIFPSFEP